MKQNKTKNPKPQTTKKKTAGYTNLKEGRL
jgi:hypothetical protein